MEKFGILVKSYLNDIAYVDRLLRSFIEHNRDNIKLYLVVPKKDFSEFISFEGGNVYLIEEEIFSLYLTKEPVGTISPGYINQEIVKLAFWELELCENYLCVDSDGIFIRDFYYSDFMKHDTPYTILVEDNELKIEPEYYNIQWRDRDFYIKRILDALGLPKDESYITCHGFAILSGKVLRSLKDNFMSKNGYTYLSLMEISHYEFSWYNLWLQSDRTIRILPREPMFKTFHHRNHHLELLIKNISVEDIKRGYVGMVVNSNYSRYMGVVGFDDPKYKIVANYFTLGEILNSIRYKVISKIFGKKIT